MSAPTRENVECFSQKIKEDIGQNQDWKPERSCKEYLRKWKTCKSFYGQFHHYYVYGTKEDCQPRKTRYENCVLWEQTHSLEAKHKLEELEHQDDLKRTKYPPLWEPRTQPPENWNSPIENTDEKRTPDVT